MAKITRQNVPLLVTPIRAQGRETAGAWVVKEGAPEEVGVQQWVLHPQRMGMCMGGLPPEALSFALSRRRADGH